MAPSHFSEKGRWALQLAAVDFEEIRLTPGLHRPVLRRIGAGSSVPALVSERGLFKDSSSILLEADRLLPDSHKLYPEAGRAEILAYEEEVAREVGHSVPRWAYAHVLSYPNLIVPVLLDGVVGWQKVLFPWLFPLVRAFMRRGLRLTPERTELMRNRIQHHFDRVAQRLGDREYLFGDRFTAADLSLAALSAPLLDQVGYGGALLPRARCPAVVRDQIEAWQAHPIAAYVDRIYRRHRHHLQGA